jgi:hypothetical protein
MKWAGNVARMRQMRNIYKILIRNLKGKYLLEDLGVDGRILLKQILGIGCQSMDWINLKGGSRQVAGSC